jgi:SAM-dependent methyltransferase
MLSHEDHPHDVDAAAEQARARIVERGDTLLASVDEQLGLLADLLEFPLGRFLLVHRGLNGYWTRQVVVYHPGEGRKAAVDEQGRPYTELERRLFDLPAFQATQERFTHFRHALQADVREGVRMASLPCGLMDDLLTLDFSAVTEFSLTGIDLDEDALRGAAARALNQGLAPHASFLRSDAWALEVESEFDVLTSNGLNIYEPSAERVVLLYARFHRALVPGGRLVTSYVTPPGSPEQHTAVLDPDALRLQQIVFRMILDVGWTQFRTSDETCAQLREVGFEVEDIARDRAGLFPTIVARRPLR